MARLRQWRVECYIDATGEAPAEQFIKGLPPQTQAELLRAIRLLSEFGPALREPHVAYLGQGLWELRARSAALIYCVQAGRRFVILHGYLRKGSAIPLHAMNTALEFQADLLGKAEEAHG